LKQSLCPRCNQEQTSPIDLPALRPAVPIFHSDRQGARELERANSVLAAAIKVGAWALVMVATTFGFLVGGLPGGACGLFVSAVFSGYLLLRLHGAS
jgi:hypothetical protein